MFTKCSMKILTDKLQGTSFVPLLINKAEFDNNKAQYYILSNDSYVKCTEESIFSSSERYYTQGYYIENLIDGYYTSSVSGRETVETELSTVAVGEIDGERKSYKRFKPRTLNISFAIADIPHMNDDNINTRLLSALDMLNYYIDLDDAKVIFDDEPDKYYIVTNTGLPEMSKGLGVATGTFQLYCLDPFKYSITLDEVVGSIIKEGTETDPDDQVITYSYRDMSTLNNGGLDSHPSFEINFGVDENQQGIIGTNADCGYINIRDSRNSNDGYSIQFGDDEETDSSDPIFVNTNFKAFSLIPQSWSITTGPQLSSSYVNGGGSGTTCSGTKGLYATGYGTATKNKYKGPYRGINIIDNRSTSTNFYFEWESHISVTSKSQAGAFVALAVDGSDNIIAGISLYKKSTANTYGGISYFYRKDNALKKVVYSSKVSLSSAKNKSTGKQYSYFGTDKNGKCYISRALQEDGTHRITIKTPVGTKYLDGCAGEKVTKIIFGFYKRAQVKKNAYLTGLNVNSVYNVRYSLGSIEDVKNTFGSSDALVIDCSDMTVKLNGIDAPGLGDVGNDWDNLVVKPGTNEFIFTWSDWVHSGYEPNIIMRYRKRYI